MDMTDRIEKKDRIERMDMTDRLYRKDRIERMDRLDRRTGLERQTRWIESVPDRRRRIHLEVVLVRRWAIWVLEIWKGRVWGKGGSRGVSLQAT
jgi:hypothetical protein